MENLMSQLQSLSQGTDFSTIGITDYQIERVGMVTCLVVLVISLLNCFFGLKLLKVWTTLLGFVIGFSLGFGISAAFGATHTVSLAIAAVAGIALGAVGFFLYLAGVFILCWIFGAGVVLAVTGTTSTVIYIIAAVVGLIIAVIALKFVEPMVILATGLQGGLSAGTAIVTLTSLPGAYTYLIIGLIVSAAGILVQFLMESRKKVKLHLKKANKVREENSTENEVEKLRSTLDNTDKVKEDVDADDYYDDEDND